jgi:hypothetical protein
MRRKKRRTVDDGVPGPAIRLARFVNDVIEFATTLPEDQDAELMVNCRRRPGHKRCPGKIRTAFDANAATISWTCPVCGDHGIISRRREGSAWDSSDGRPQH